MGKATGAGRPPDLAAAALGVSVAELAQALGPPPPNLPAAAQILRVSLAELEAAIVPP